MSMDRTRRALNASACVDAEDARLHTLHALSGLRLALLPGVEVLVEAGDSHEQLPYGIDGAAL
jgi:hypothetical protein